MNGFLKTETKTKTKKTLLKFFNYFTWAKSSQGSFFLWHLRIIPLHLSPESCHLCHLEVICEQCWSLGQPKLVNQAEQTMQMEWKGEAMKNSGPHCLGHFKAKPSCSRRCCLGPLVATLMSSLQNITFWKLYSLNAWSALHKDFTLPWHLSKSPKKKKKSGGGKKNEKKYHHHWGLGSQPHCPLTSRNPAPSTPNCGAADAFCNLLVNASPFMLFLASNRMMI